MWRGDAAALRDLNRITHGAVCRAVREKLDAARRDGTALAAVDAIARDIIEGAGYHGAFGHSLGHSVGLEIHEAPNFAPRSADFFENGHVITVEPGIYLAGKYGCRIEDMVWAHDGTVTSLTHSKKELIELF